TDGWALWGALPAAASAALACLRAASAPRAPGPACLFFSAPPPFSLAPWTGTRRPPRLNIDLNSGLVGVRILFDVIDHPPTEHPDEQKPALKLSTARVEFSDVQFSYRPGEKVIRNLSFVAEPGKVTALVGPSGGGKSTILNLILRLYEVEGGSIAIDG